MYTALPAGPAEMNGALRQRDTHATIFLARCSSLLLVTHGSSTNFYFFTILNSVYRLFFLFFLASCPIWYDHLVVSLLPFKIEFSWDICYRVRCLLWTWSCHTKFINIRDWPVTFPITDCLFASGAEQPTLKILLGHPFSLLTSFPRFYQIDKVIFENLTFSLDSISVRKSLCRDF